MSRTEMIITRESGRTSKNYFLLTKKICIVHSAIILISFLKKFRFVYQNFKKHLLQLGFI